MSLFKLGDFTLYSGAKSVFKIDCDALTDEDWDTLAYLINQRCKFSSVLGVPNGGLKLEAALQKYVTIGPALIVDDVLTTGTSMDEARHNSPYKSHIGYVVFARSKCPSWINALFYMEASDERE